MAVGVGSGANQAEIEAMASQQEFAFHVTDFASLDQGAQDVSDEVLATCD